MVLRSTSVCLSEKGIRLKSEAVPATVSYADNIGGCYTTLTTVHLEWEGI